MVYFALEVRARWPQIAQLPWTGAVLAGFGAVTLAQVLAAWFGAIGWAWLLRALRVRATGREAVGICFTSQFGKYVPGNLGHHIGRVALAQRVNWPPGRVLFSMLVETGFALGVGALLAVTGIFLVNVADQALGSRLRIIAVLLALGWVIGTLLLRVVLARPPSFVKKWLRLEEPVTLKVSLLVACSVVQLFGFVSLAGGLMLLLWAISGQWPNAMWLVPAAISVAWLAGFVVPGAPAGLGVREAAVTALLGPVLGHGAVVSTALLWRFSSLLADALMFGVGVALTRDSKARAVED